MYLKQTQQIDPYCNTYTLPIYLQIRHLSHSSQVHNIDYTTLEFSSFIE